MKWQLSTQEEGCLLGAKLLHTFSISLTPGVYAKSSETPEYLSKAITSPPRLIMAWVDGLEIASLWRHFVN